jgi:hypothetical protein
MKKYEQIKEAMNTFGLSEHETMAEIRRKINSLIKKYHPDTCAEEPEICIEKSRLLLDLKKIIMDYCENYKISFEKHEVKKYLNPAEFWEDHFAKDALWGNIVRGEN